MLHKFLKLNLFILLLITLCSRTYVSEAVTKELTEPVQVEDIKILALIDTGFGYNYYVVKDQFESWGSNFTTAAPTRTVASCPNRPQRPTTADILFSELNRGVLSEFHCIFVPSGSYWSSFSNNQAALNLITMAYEEGLIVSSMCVGPAVLARAGVMDGVKATGHSNIHTVIQSSGAILVRDVNVVCDSRVITGGPGGGFESGGYTTAPTYQFCSTVVSAILGYSYVVNVVQAPLSGTSNTTFTINAEILPPANISESLAIFNATEVREVKATIFFQNSSSEVRTVTLTDEDQNNIYSGNFTGIGLETGNYNVSIEVKDNNEVLEVARDKASFYVERTIGEETSTTTTPIISTPFITVEILLIAIVVLTLTLGTHRKLSKNHLT
ncbi:MAG: DJ-1/PfpI family protein [Candidatus Hodarchaeota archaeon]